MPEPDRTADAATTGRSGGYATGHATKQAIVEHAATAFAQKGFYGTSLRGIAREVGIDHTLLLHHFGNKTALLLAVIDWYDHRHGRIEQFDGDFGAVLVEGIVGAARRNATAPGLVRLLSVLSAEAGDEDHPARQALQQRHELLVRSFATGIRQRDEVSGSQVEPGDHEERLSAELRATLLISVWEGLQVFDALHPGAIDLPELLGRAADRLI